MLQRQFAVKYMHRETSNPSTLDSRPYPEDEEDPDDEPGHESRGVHGACDHVLSTRVTPQLNGVLCEPKTLHAHHL